MEWEGRMPLNRRLGGHPFSEGRAPMPQETWNSNASSPERAKSRLGGCFSKLLPFSSPPSTPKRKALD